MRSFSHCTCRSRICAIEAGCATCHGSKEPDEVEGEVEGSEVGPGLNTAKRERERLSWDECHSGGGQGKKRVGKSGR